VTSKLSSKYTEKHGWPINILILRKLKWQKSKKAIHMLQTTLVMFSYCCCQLSVGFLNSTGRPNTNLCICVLLPKPW
jgi:hypothetical protein